MRVASPCSGAFLCIFEMSDLGEGDGACITKHMLTEESSKDSGSWANPKRKVTLLWLFPRKIPTSVPDATAKAGLTL